MLYTVPSFGVSNQKSARFGRQGIESRFLEHAAVAALDAASLVLEAMLAMPGQKSRMRTLERSLRRDGKAGTVDQ